MSIIRRVPLLVLAVFGLYTGAWAYVAPHHWFTHFPGAGLVWLPPLGPYNQHLSADAGAMFLALTVLSLFTLRHVRNDLLCRAAGSAWLTFNLLHAIFHFQHLDMYDGLDKILNAALLPVVVVVAAALFVPVSRGGRRDVAVPADHVTGGPPAT